MPDSAHDRRRVLLPRPERGPLRLFAQRLAIAVGLICFVALVAYIDRDGYVDADGNAVSLLDAFYYATVSVSTTGYGDIRPETQEARLVNTLLVTPARVLFLIVLVGTTVEILAERTREAIALRRWRGGLSGHIIICGFGSKGRAAVHTLLGQGQAAEDIVVIDGDETAIAAARSQGLAVVRGDAARVEVLREAGIERASAIIVGPQRDDAAVLITLTARELNPNATIVAAVREEENAHLLRQSGADSVITSSGAAGRLLGLATHRPRIVEVLEDLLSVGTGLDIVERRIGSQEAGPLAALHRVEPVIAVIRNDELYRFDDARVSVLHEGDRVVQLCSRPD